MTEGLTATVVCPSCGGANLPGSRFCSSCGTALESRPSSAETRKTVTVLFCDASSSTSLGEQLDPESLRGLMTRYFDVMQQAVEFHGGVVEKFIGDAVMAVFGVPTVHEDDALRACRAAMEIRQRLAELDDRLRVELGTTIVWRMGINTGEVVTGDPTARQRIVTGDPVNVAARLEAAAEPGETFIGGETHALVHDSVTAEPVVPLMLKGKSEPVSAWRLLGVRDERTRHARPLEAPLVGRRRPLRLLEEAFREAVEERVCHLVTVLGVAGVGKSRLVDEFVGTVGDTATVAFGRCLAYGHGITYWPVAEALRSATGLTEAEPPETILGRLRDVLHDEPDAARIAAMVGGLVGIEDSPASPDETFWAIRKTFEAVARSRPLILVFDDVHWGESTFLDLVEHMADWTRDAPITLIVMARGELLDKRPAWSGGKRWATTMSLEPLSEVESEELVTSLLGHMNLPNDVRLRISNAAEGNPLFLEELLGKLIDDGFLVAGDNGWSMPDDLRELTIPPSIQALLSARLDGLNAEERSVIQRAAVEGKVFHRGAVVELAPETIRDSVGTQLTSLMRMELVRPDQASFAGDEAYRFRHLLIRDAAYQALAKQTRSDLHERFAAWLQEVAADRQLEYEEIIGYHLEQAYRYRMELGPSDAATAELAGRAGQLIANAGERASRRGDMAATVDLLARAVELLPEAESRGRRLPWRLGDALYHAGDAARAEAILERAVAEARDSGDEAAAAIAEVALVWVRSSTRSVEISVVLNETEHAAEILERSGATADARFARASAAFALFASGHAAQAIERAGALLELGESDEAWYEEAQMARGAAMVFGPTPIDEAVAVIGGRIDQVSGNASLSPRVGIARLLPLQGRFAEAREHLAVARTGFEELGNRHRLAGILEIEGIIASFEGDAVGAARQLREAFDAMTATGDRSFASTFAASLGRGLLDLGDFDQALRFGDIARTTSSSDDAISQAGGRAVQARVLSEHGDHEAAEALAREAEGLMAATDYLVSHGEVSEDLARVLHGAGKTDEAMSAARAAIALFEAKGATVPAARATRMIEEWLLPSADQ